MALSPNWTYNPVGVAADALTGKQYIESAEGGKESFSSGSSEAERVFYVQWKQRAAFLDDLLGYSYCDGSLNIKRILPDPHPDYATFYAMSASVEPHGPPGINTAGTAADYKVAKVTAKYSHPEFDIVADAEITTELDRYVTRSYGSTADFLTLQGVMKFCSSIVNGQPRPLQINPARIVCKDELTYTWHEVPCPVGPWDEISMEPPNLANVQACIGKVNSVLFDGYPAGTVLFLGMTPRLTTPRLNTDGWFWEIELKFIHQSNGTADLVAGDTLNKAVGHNYIWDQANGHWDLITSTGTVSGNQLFQFADLNTIFKVSA